MLFHEYALTPQIFSKEYCEDRLFQKDLANFLKGLRKNSMLGNLNKEQWQREVKNELSLLPLSLRDRLMMLLQELSKYNRIVPHDSLTKDKNLEGEEEWLELMKEENDIEPYSAIITTENAKQIHTHHFTLEQLLEHPSWDNRKYSFIINQTKENLEKHTKKFLLYARKLTISDPYFTYNKNDDEVLMLYASLFAKRRGKRLKNRQIIIHTSYNEKDRYVDVNSLEYKRKWVKVFRRIYEYFGHKTTLNVWKDENRPKLVHDRYMITDQGGIYSGKGFSIDGAEFTLGLLENDDMRKCLNKFEANYAISFSLVFSLDKDCEIDETQDTQGKVVKLLNDNERGKNGFVRGESGESYYFYMSTSFYLCEQIKEGVLVEFDSYETEKGKNAKILKVITN